MSTSEGPSRDSSRRRQIRAIDTRQRILDAAAKVLFEEGYSAATTLHIQQVAGVSRGRLLHHFPSRAVLLSAAVRHIGVERMQSLISTVRLSDDPVERIAIALRTMWESTGEPYFWASMELWLGARTAGGELKRALSVVERQMGEVVRVQADYLFGEAIVAHPDYPKARELVVSSMRGVRLTYAFTDRDPADDAYLVRWQWLFEQLIASA